MRHAAPIIAFAAGTIAFAGSHAHAQAHAQAQASAEPVGGMLSVTYENDVFGGTDWNYTSGARVGWLSAETQPIRLERALTEILVGDEDTTFRRGFAVGQTLYTPINRQTTSFLTRQHPYAAFLFGEYTLLAANEGRMTRLSAQAGVFGPLAAGDWAQNTVHDLTGDAPVLGWENQIENTPAFAVSYDTAFSVARAGEGAVQVDLVPNAGATLGNARTDIHGGITARLGSALSTPDLPFTVQPGGVGAGTPVGDGCSGWLLFAGVQGRAIAQELAIEGDLPIADGTPRPARESLVGDVVLGGAVRRGRVQLSYTHTVRSETFDTQNGSHTHGTLTLGVGF